MVALERRCTSRPALAGRSRPAEFELQFADVFDQIGAYAAGTPINVVNPEVFEQLP